MEAIADILYELPKSYGLVFDIAHYVVCLQAERADLGPAFQSLTRSNPLASWASAMMICFAGAILVNPICGGSDSSPLQFLEDPLRVGIATLLWYLMFYSPNDFAYKASKKFGAQVPIYVIKGMYYPKKIVAGIKHAKHSGLDPRKNWLAAILVATLKANGSGFIKPLARFVRGGVNTNHGWETVNPSVTTKVCLICAVLYTFAPTDLTYIGMVGLTVAMKVGPLFGITAVETALKVLDEKVVPAIFRRQELKEDVDAKKDE